jgi:hypothetical protein
MDNTEIRKEIKRLKRLKKDLRPGSKERIEIFRKIKDLKKQRAEITAVEPGKEELITEILSIYDKQNIKPRFEDIGIDLHIYTIKQLELHLKKIRP